MLQRSPRRSRLTFFVRYIHARRIEYPRLQRDSLQTNDFINISKSRIIEIRYHSSLRDLQTTVNCFQLLVKQCNYSEIWNLVLANEIRQKTTTKKSRLSCGRRYWRIFEKDGRASIFIVRTITCHVCQNSTFIHIFSLQPRDHKQQNYIRLWPVSAGFRNRASLDGRKKTRTRYLVPGTRYVRSWFVDGLHEYQQVRNNAVDINSCDRGFSRLYNISDPLAASARNAARHALSG